MAQGGNGPELSDALDRDITEITGPRPKVHGPPFRRALAFLGFWVRRSSVARESAPRQLASLPNGVASLQGPSEPCARAHSGPLVTTGARKVVIKGSS
jgi:hypothetical protein